MSQYFPKLYGCPSRNVKVELNLRNSAIKADLKGATSVDTSNLAAKLDLASLKAQENNIDVDKIEIVLAYLSKLSNPAENVVR